MDLRGLVKKMDLGGLV